MMNVELTPHNGKDGSTFRGYLQLLRLPNVFTSLADATMGFLFVRELLAPDDWAALATILTASGLLYAAGVVLNDVFDLKIDCDERPERPLPSGRVLLSAARRLGWILLTLGVAFGWAAGMMVGHGKLGVIAALLAACIVLYDAWLKHTPAGPPTMGACRMLNVAMGMSAVAAPLDADHWLVAGGIGVYVAGLTWFARTENRRSSRLHLTAATVVMAGGIAMLAWFPSWSDRVIERIQLDPDRWLLLVGVLGLLIVWRCFWAVVEPAPQNVRRAVAQCVLSIVMLDAVVCFAVRGVAWACLILLFLVPAFFLGKCVDVT